MRQALTMLKIGAKYLQTKEKASLNNPPSLHILTYSSMCYIFYRVN